MPTKKQEPYGVASAAARGVTARKLARFGATRLPAWVLKGLPPVFGLSLGLASPEARRQLGQVATRLHGPLGKGEYWFRVAQQLAEYSHCVADSLGYDGWGKNIEERGVLLGGEHLLEAVENNRGLIVVTAHTGAWEVAAAMLGSATQARVMMVMSKEQDERAAAVHLDAVKDLPIETIRIGNHPLDALPVLRHLRDGGVVALQLDRCQNGQDFFELPFASSSLKVPVGPFALAARAKVPVIPIFCARTSFRRYLVEAFPKIELSGSERTDLEKAAISAAENLDFFLLRHPTQWFHFTE